MHTEDNVSWSRHTEALKKFFLKKQFGEKGLWPFKSQRRVKQRERRRVKELTREAACLI